MDRPQLSKFVCFCVLMLAINTWVSAQHAKPSYVLKYLPGNEANESDPFLQRIPKNIIEALHDLDEVDVISPYTSSSYPAQYYLEIKPAYLHYIWKEGTYHFGKIAPENKRLCFDYRANYSPKITLTLGSIATGQVLNVYELKTMSTLPDRRNCLRYDEVGYQEGLPLEPADQQKYLQKAVPILREMLPEELMTAEEILRKEFNWAVSDVLYHFFPTRHQVRGLKLMRMDSIELDIQGIQTLKLHHYQPLFVYTLKQFNQGADTYERIELLGEVDGCLKKGVFTCGFYSKTQKNIQAALDQNQMVWCSPAQLKYVSTLKERPPSIAFNIRTSGIAIEPNVLNQLYQRLRAEALNVRGKQLIILDREKIPGIKWQQNENKSNSYLDKPFIEQFKSIGARYILDIEIQTAEVKYTGSFFFMSKFVPRLIDVETGEILAESISEHENWWSGMKTPGISYPEYLAIVQRKPEDRPDYVRGLGFSYYKFNLREVLNRSIPSKIQVAELTEVEKDKAQQILINGNFNENTLNDDYHVCVKKEVLVDGAMETRWEQIGRISIKSPVGDGLALAKVKQGEKEINAAFQKKEKLYCFDRPEWLIDRFYTRQLKKAGF